MKSIFFSCQSKKLELSIDGLIIYGLLRDATVGKRQNCFFLKNQSKLYPERPFEFHLSKWRLLKIFLACGFNLKKFKIFRKRNIVYGAHWMGGLAGNISSSLPVVSLGQFFQPVVFGVETLRFEHWQRSKISDVLFRFLNFMDHEYSAAHARTSQITLKMIVTEWLIKQWTGDMNVSHF